MTPKSTSCWTVEVFFDGDCPLCRREIDLVRRFDRQDRIRLTDIANPEFDPTRFGMSQQAFMDEIQGRLSDGRWITGVEVFRQIYAALGLRPLVVATRLPIISHALEWGYRIFARNRLNWTGRCNSSAACRI